MTLAARRFARSSRSGSAESSASSARPSPAAAPEPKSAAEAAMKPSAAAALGVAEIGRAGKHRQNNRHFCVPQRELSHPELVLSCRHVLRRYEDKSPHCCVLCPDGGVTHGIAALTGYPAGSKLPPIRRPAHDIRHPEFLERRLESPIPRSRRAGLRRFHQNPATAVFFAGVFLTGIGSSHYHWNPNDGTLFWDRLPMTLSFAAIFALVVEERVSHRAGAILLWPALAIGVFGLLLWRWTDDLRLYFWVQFFPGVAVILLFLLYPPKYIGTRYWIAAGVLYALAKLFEFTDEMVYSVGGVVSGHTLKHLAAAAACFAILRYFQTRQSIHQGPPKGAGERRKDRTCEQISAHVDSVPAAKSEASTHHCRSQRPAAPFGGRWNRQALSSGLSA